VKTLRKIKPKPAWRTMRMPLHVKPSVEERARDAMRALAEEGEARIPGDGAAFSRVYRILEKRFALEREAFHAGNVDHVHAYRLRRDLYADAWIITRELLPPVTPEVRDAYRAKVADRVSLILEELRSYGVAGFGDTRERSPIDGHWFDTETLYLLEVEAAREGLRYRVNPCQGFDFAWIDRLT
jgi:hypothetical protein